MKRPCCSLLLGFGLLLVTFSLEMSQEVSRARKLCGRHLLSEIVKFCGPTNWSQFSFEGGTPLAESTSQESPQAFKEDHFHSTQAYITVQERFTNPAPASTLAKKAASSWEVQPQPAYQYEKANLLPEKIREFSSSRGVSPHTERVKRQKKNMNKIKTINGLFWGYHPQRKRRGYLDKCCLKGCTKEELAVACLPYFHF